MDVIFYMSLMLLFGTLFLIPLSSNREGLKLERALSQYHLRGFQDKLSLHSVLTHHHLFGCWSLLIFYIKRESQVHGDDMQTYGFLALSFKSSNAVTFSRKHHLFVYTLGMKKTWIFFSQYRQNASCAHFPQRFQPHCLLSCSYQKLSWENECSKGRCILIKPRDVESKSSFPNSGSY